MGPWSSRSPLINILQPGEDIDAKDGLKLNAFCLPSLTYFDISTVISKYQAASGHGAGLLSSTLHPRSATQPVTAGKQSEQSPTRPTRSDTHSLRPVSRQITPAQVCVTRYRHDSGAASFPANRPLLKGSMPPSIGHMELLVWMQRADFSEHIQGCKSPGDPLNSSHFDAPNTKSAPTGYRRAPNIISHHYKQQLSAKASIVPKARPIRFR